MSTTIGVRVIFGVDVDADSDSLSDFIMAKLLSNNHVPRQMFQHFNEYFDHFILGNGDEPLYDRFTDYHHYFQTVINQDSPDRLLGCFRQSCCLSNTWKQKMVIGVQLTHVSHLWLSPQGIDFPNLSQDIIQHIQSQLSDHGFSTDTKMFFILDDCLRCT